MMFVDGSSSEHKVRNELLELFAHFAVALLPLLVQCVDDSNGVEVKITCHSAVDVSP